MSVAARYRSIRVNGSVNSVPELRARSLVSRGLAEYVTETRKPKRGRPKGSKNKPKPVSAEYVYAHPDVPIEDSSLPDPTRTGEAIDIAGNKPPIIE